MYVTWPLSSIVMIQIIGGYLKVRPLETLSEALRGTKYGAREASHQGTLSRAMLTTNLNIVFLLYTHMWSL